jgi:hypothetical protein
MIFKVVVVIIILFLQHIIHIYLKYHSVCPLVRIGTPPSVASEFVPPEPKGGTHSPADEGVVGSQFGRLEKSLALCLLCGMQHCRSNYSAVITVLFALILVRKREKTKKHLPNSISTLPPLILFVFLA